VDVRRTRARAQQARRLDGSTAQILQDVSNQCLALRQWSDRELALQRVKFAECRLSSEKNAEFVTLDIELEVHRVIASEEARNE